LSLTPPQRKAIEKLTAGHTVADSATAAGVNRCTLYRWLKHDPEFQAAYNAWQQDAIATARGRLLALTDTAVTAVGKAMLQWESPIVRSREGPTWRNSSASRNWSAGSK
jgi:hypothetical protein